MMDQNGYMYSAPMPRVAMTHPRWRSLARARGMSSSTIRRFPRLVRAVVTGVLPDVGWRITNFPRGSRRLVIVSIEGHGEAMVEACR